MSLSLLRMISLSHPTQTPTISCPCPICPSHYQGPCTMTHSLTLGCRHHQTRLQLMIMWHWPVRLGRALAGTLEISTNTSSNIDAHSMGCGQEPRKKRSLLTVSVSYYIIILHTIRFQVWEMIDQKLDKNVPYYSCSTQWPIITTIT